MTMPLSDKEFKLAERIFYFVCKENFGSVQFYRPDEEFRQHTIIVKGLVYGDIRYCDSVYVNIEKLNTWQYNNFIRKAEKELPGKCFIDTFDKEKIVRFGFK